MYDLLFSRQAEKLINSFLHFDSVGRIDDVVIHSSGEKTVPTPIKDIVMSSTQCAISVKFLSRLTYLN